jgi:hypothetical protein
MPFQTLTLELDGITAGDYLTWCRDPDPPALDFALRSISIDAHPLGSTITATLDWNQPIPAAPAAATAAGLPLSPGVQVRQLVTGPARSGPVDTEDGPHLTSARPARQKLAHLSHLARHQPTPSRPNFARTTRNCNPD